MIHPILQMGDPRLLLRSAVVDEVQSPAIQQLITDLFDSMRAVNGAGLAAPQVGVLQRVVVFGVAKNPRYPNAEPVPDTVLINPVIEVLSETQSLGWEGCLSVAGLRGEVARFEHIRYSGFNELGEWFCREAKGFHARVVQHECDHLDGVLYPMRVNDFSRFGFTKVLFPEMAESDD
jgi:peptide deformylase